MATNESPELARIAKRLDRLDARLADVERTTKALHELVGTRIRRSWRDKFRPKLWQFKQYPPRVLRTPPAYAERRPPENAPRIAIVTPSFNHARFLPATIDSVLAQGYPNLAYLVQDGGSTAHVFRNNPAVDIVYGHRIFIDEDGLETGRCVLPNHDAKTLEWADYIPQETMLWRRRVWEKIGPIDESFRFALDWDFILRAQASGFRFKRLPRFLGCFRVHDEQKTTAMMEIGHEEQRRLRRAHLGRDPTRREIDRAVRGYVRRHILFHRLYKLGVLAY